MATLLNQLSLIVTHTAVQLGAGLIIGSVCEVVFDSQHLVAPTSWSDFLSASVVVGAQLLLNAMFVAAAISYAMVPGLADPAGMFVFLYTLNFTQPVLSTNTALVAKYVQAQLGGTVSAYQKIEGGELLMPGHTRKQQIPSNLYIRS